MGARLDVCDYGIIPFWFWNLPWAFPALAQHRHREQSRFVVFRCFGPLHSSLGSSPNLGCHARVLGLPRHRLHRDQDLASSKYAFASFAPLIISSTTWRPG